MATKKPATVSISDVAERDDAGAVTSPRSVLAMRLAGCSPSDIEAVGDSQVLRRAREAGRTGKLSEAERAVILQHLQSKRRAAIKAVQKQRDKLIQADEARKRITAVLVERGSLDAEEAAQALAGGGPNEALALKERRRMAQVREKQQAEMQAALNAELSAAADLKARAEEAKKTEKEDAKRRKEIEAERQKQAEARKREADAKAKKEAEALQAAEKQQKAWYAQELLRQASVQAELEERRKASAAKAKAKAAEMLQQQRQAEQAAEAEAARAAERAEQAKQRQAELLANLEQKREAQRAEIQRKALIAKRRVEKALLANKVRQREQKERFLASMAEADARRNKRMKEIQETLDMKAKEREMKEKEARDRIVKRRVEVERWRDELVRKEEVRGKTIFKVQAEKAEAARARELDASLHVLAKQSAVRMQRRKEQARNQHMREELERQQERMRHIQAQQAQARKRVEANARKLLIEKHSLQHETDMLRITKRYDQARKKHMAPQKEDGEEA